MKKFQRTNATAICVWYKRIHSQLQLLMRIRSDIYNYFVGTRACLKMNWLKEAITWCEMGLAVSFILALLLGRFHGNSFFFSWHKSSSRRVPSCRVGNRVRKNSLYENLTSDNFRKTAVLMKEGIVN